MGRIHSIPVRQLSFRFSLVRGAFREVQATTDFNDCDHGTSVEQLAEHMDALERLIYRLHRVKE